MMLTVEMTLLGGRYRATNFEDRRRVEWPPEPARLFYAAVDAVYRQDPLDQAEVGLLRKWESLGAPHISCSDRAEDAEGWVVREVVDHYVPGNYATSWTRDIQPQWEKIAQQEADLAHAGNESSERDVARRERNLEKAWTKLRADTERVTRSTGTESATVAAAVLELLPENRNKQARTFPTVRPDDPQICFTWPESDLDERYRVTLDGILTRIARVGHSSSMVTCRLVDHHPKPTWVPAGPRSVKPGQELRTMTTGLLDALVAEFSRHQGRTGRVMPAVITRYERPAEIRVIARRTEVGEWIVLPFDRRQRLALSRTPDIARSVRAALIAHAEEPVHPVISGHATTGGDVRDLRSPHLSVLVLPNVSHVYSDGMIHAVAIGLPTSVSHADREAVIDALRRWSRDDGGFDLTLPGGTHRRLGPAILDSGSLQRRDSGAVATRQFWAREELSWSTVTPVALDRHPRVGKRPDYDELNAAIAPLVTAMCRRSGLPDPVDVLASPGSIWASVPPVAVGGQRSHGRAAFPQYSVGGSAGNRRFTTHLTIRFGEDVRGPIILGAGRYFGYGLMLPTPSTTKREPR